MQKAQTKNKSFKLNPVKAFKVSPKINAQNTPLKRGRCSLTLI
jgi:hypothetical protein